jgi:hypothetical protein
MYTIRWYRIFDTGKEIDLVRLEETLAASLNTARAGFVRVDPKSMSMEVPPVLLRLDPIYLEKSGREFTFNSFAKLYDIGAISICFAFENRDSDDDIEETALLFAGQEGLSDHFLAALEYLKGILSTQNPNLAIDPDFFEDYTIYTTDRMEGPYDPVVLLTGEKVHFSQQTRDEVLKNALSYAIDDRSVLSWDSALLISPDIPHDIIDLIEFANVEVFELRYYDRELSRLMEKMYIDIESADRLSRILRMQKYHLIMASLMESYAEISEVTEKINNLIKITEDIYYARVYAVALKVLRSGQWTESVDRRIEVIQRNYAMLSDEVNIQHSNFLEWIIIILIALEFVFAIWQSLR